jgi:O-antigen/teichoic acid export membrane protein
VSPGCEYVCGARTEPALAMTTKRMTDGTLAGLFWSFLGHGFRGVAQLVTLSVLARLLTLTDFGVVTAGLAVIGISMKLSGFGIGNAVVQLPTFETRHVRVAFTVSLGFGALTFVLIWLTAPFVAAFFRMPALSDVLRALSVVCVLQGRAVVAESLLQRRMQFRVLAGVDAVSYAVGYGVVGIGLAFLGFGVWAFVGAHIAQATGRMILLRILQPHPAMPLLERRTILDLVHYGGGITLGTMGNYVATEGDNVIVGRWLGAEALGLYGRAYQLMAMPAMFVGEVLNKVLFPSMSRVQDQPERLVATYGRALALIALIILPLSAGLLILAPEIVHVLLGPKWMGMVVPFQVFATGMLFRTSYKISNATIGATGAVYQRTWRLLAYGLLVLAGAWAGSSWGLPGVAIGVVVAIGLNYALLAQLSLTLTGMSWRRFLSCHLPGIIVASIVGAELWILVLVLRSQALSPPFVLMTSIAAVLCTLLLLLRYVPRRVLGEDGYWLLQTFVSYLPERLARLNWLRLESDRRARSKLSLPS